MDGTLKQAIGYQCHVFLLTACTSRIIFAKDPMGELQAGASTIIGPTGKVLASKAGKDEGFAMADIDLAAIAAAKEKYDRNTKPVGALFSSFYK